MRPDEIALAADWAAAEGWNPGLADAACFATVDAAGFLIGELDGAPAATISCVNYDERFAFLGFYIVRPDLRGRGYGLRIWNAAIAHAGGAHGRPRRRGGAAGELQASRASRSPTPISDTAERSRRRPRRPTRSSRWRRSPLPPWRRTTPRFSRRRGRRSCARGSTRPGHIGRALVRDGKLAAWGVIRPCRTGCKIGPLVADDRAAAEARVRGAGRGGRRRRSLPRRARASTARRSRSRKATALRRCSRPRGCIPGRSVRCGSSACSASPRLSWDDLVPPGARSCGATRSCRRSA